MSQDYGVKLNLTAIIHEDNSFEAGLKFEDTSGIKFDWSVDDDNIDDAIKDLATNFVFNYIAAQKTNDDTAEQTENKNIEEKKPKFESRFKQTGRTSTTLSNKLDKFLKRLE